VEELLTFLEGQFSTIFAEKGDEESFRLLEATRDAALTKAEEDFFSKAILQEIQSKPNQRVLLFDLGGPPQLGSRILATLPSTASVGYVRLDPNPASLKASRKLLSASSASYRLLSADPALASLQDSDWNYIKSKADACIVLLAGCSWNSFLEHHHMCVDSFMRSSSLSLASLLTLERLPFMLKRLQSVKAQGALFDTVRVRPVVLEEDTLVYKKEISWALMAKPPRLRPVFGYYELGVAISDGPTFPLVNIFSLEYLQEELLAGFQFRPGPAAGEGQLFSLRFTH
jgi:hypothetical protein